MESEPLISIAETPKTPRFPAKGRPVDLLAAVMAGFAGLAAIILTGVFFWGFAENDRQLPGLFSAFAFSAILGSFAIFPACYIAHLAFKGWREGLPRKSAWRVLLLSLPWAVLSMIFIRQTPIPPLLSWLILFVSAVLSLWATASLFLHTSRNIDER